MKNNILLLILIFICVSCQSEVNHNVPDKNIYVRKELSKQELNNLEAISRLYGYVRYFYPHTETKKFKELDWYKFLVYSIDKTIYSKNDEELKTNLLNVFQPIIPNLSFNEDSNPMGTPTKSSTIYYWKHRGIGKHLSGDSTFISKLVEGTNLNNAGLVADSMYEFPLNERLNIYYPLALSNISNQKNKDWEKTKKEVSKIKFRLFNKSTLQLLLGDEDRSWALLKDDKFRYADLIVRWNIIQHFYPYYNEEHLDETWSSRLCSALKKAGIVENESQYLDTGPI